MVTHITTDCSCFCFSKYWNNFAIFPSKLIWKLVKFYKNPCWILNRNDIELIKLACNTKSLHFRFDWFVCVTQKLYTFYQEGTFFRIISMGFIGFLAGFNEIIFFYSFINSDRFIREVLLILQVYLYLATLIDYLMNLIFFVKLIYLFWEVGRGKERENSKQALHCQCLAQRGAGTQEPWDHDLGGNQVWRLTDWTTQASHKFKFLIDLFWSYKKTILVSSNSYRLFLNFFLDNL